MAGHTDLVVPAFETRTLRERLRVSVFAPPLVVWSALAFRVLARAPRRLSAAAHRFWANGVLYAVDAKVDLVGIKRLPARPAILLPLHEGFLDAPLLMKTGRSMRFIARSELFDWPHLGSVLRAERHIELPDRPSSADLRALRRSAKETMAAGHDLVVFPQGSILGIEVAFASGARRLAEATGAPIVPIVITGTHRVWEHPYSNRLRFGCPVRLEVLPAIAAESVRTEWEPLASRMRSIALAQRDAPARRFDPERDGFWDGYAYEIDEAFPILAKQVARHRAGLIRA